MKRSERVVVIVARLAAGVESGRLLVGSSVDVADMFVAPKAIGLLSGQGGGFGPE